MTAHPDIRLVLTDVDGTLVTNDKVLTPASIAAAEALRAADIGLAVTSSRPPRGMRMLVEPLGLTLPLAGFNGGVLAEPHDQSILANHPLATDAAAKAVEFLQQQKLDIWVYTEDEWFVRDAKGAHVEREAFILQLPPRVVETFDPLTTHAFKVVGVCDDAARLARAADGVRALLGATASASRSSGHFVDVTHPLANKGQVVEDLARRLGLRADQIATIGDSDNDTSMFAKGGLSIAMGNADPDVKAKADRVTESNEADGFARAIDQNMSQVGAASRATPGVGI